MLHPAAAQLQSPLVPDLTELIIGFVTFGVIFVALWKVLVPRISRTLADRTDAIEGGLQRAEETQAEAKRTLEAYRKQLAEARHEAARLREEAREQGAQIIAEMREQASAEAQRLIEAARTQIDADRRQALQSLRAEVGALAVDLASRVVGESLTDEARQRRTVERFLAELDQLPESADR
ncbi:MAG TPA: F0F1 ATP synthase subunit B [Streptosporangiaceae bacterium]|jgi:F-type H+-transporting ATPase subunit b|nr:F0F1 ATP synthase subunit B [Streptosporangiaceae bacterium]